MEKGIRLFVKVSLVQLAAGSDWRSNLDQCLQLACRAVPKKPDLIVFPENFLFRGESDLLKKVATEGVATALELLSAFAKCYRVSLLLGSLAVPSKIKNRFYNASILLSPQGRLQSIYHKLHLFDVSLPHLKVRESKYFISGTQVTTACVSGLRVGLSICYDLRFPELFRQFARQGCRMVFVPANFTYPTGKAHWEILLRARAIENQMFVLACAQVGTHPSSKIRSFGNSMVVDPWGRILGRLNDRQTGVLSVRLDLQAQQKLRREFPVLRHRRMDICKAF